MPFDTLPSHPESHWLSAAVDELAGLSASVSPALRRRLDATFARLARMNGGSSLLDALQRPASTPFVALIDAFARDLGVADHPAVPRDGGALNDAAPDDAALDWMGEKFLPMAVPTGPLALARLLAHPVHERVMFAATHHAQAAEARARVEDWPQGAAIARRVRGMIDAVPERLLRLTLGLSA